MNRKKKKKKTIGSFLFLSLFLCVCVKLFFSSSLLRLRRVVCYTRRRSITRQYLMASILVANSRARPIPAACPFKLLLLCSVVTRIYSSPLSSIITDSFELAVSWSRVGDTSCPATQKPSATGSPAPIMLLQN